MDAVSCGHLLLDALLAADWGLPAMMISDRDSKSMATMWKTIFDSLGTKLLRSTAYHPRTDGQSERMNQNVEMTLRYYMAKCLVGALEWKWILPQLQFALNNQINQSTGKAPNETCMALHHVKQPISRLPLHRNLN